MKLKLKRVDFASSINISGQQVSSLVAEDKARNKKFEIELDDNLVVVKELGPGTMTVVPLAHIKMMLPLDVAPVKK